MRILITGICGFIGSHMGRLLIKDHSIIGLDKFSNSRDSLRIADYMGHESFKFIQADLSQNISGVLEDIDVVINFAAYTFVDHSIRDPAPFIQSNIIGVYNLLEQARKYPVKKFIQISTDEVYGEIIDGLAKETDQLKPGNPYSATKAAADMLCLSYYNTFKIPVIILRCENNYGSFQHRQKFIPTVIKNALADKPVPIYGEGNHKRMWLRVEDFCEAIKVVIENGEEGEIYNVGAKQEIQNYALAKDILGILKKKLYFTYIPDNRARPGHDRRYGIDTSKIEALGWKPKHTLETGLPEVVEWYKQNQYWLK